MENDPDLCSRPIPPPAPGRKATDGYGAPAPDYGARNTVKDWDPDQQPRERAMRYGCGSLSKAELLAIVLRTGMPGYPVTEMCRDLMKRHGDRLHEVAGQPLKRLTEIRGLGEVKALQILAIMELGKRMALESIGERPTIRSAADIRQIMVNVIGNLDHEEIHVLLLNRRNQVTHRRMITSGTATASLFDPKQILKYALLEGALGLIMCHNHPSGNLMPSSQDDKITKKMKEACEAVDITFLDHVIITAQGYYSYNDEGRLR